MALYASEVAVPGLWGELVGMLRAVTGESQQWASELAPASRLEDDLRLESLELMALAELLRQRYGDRADLLAYLTSLDLDELIALTVGDLVAFLAARQEPR